MVLAATRAIILRRTVTEGSTLAPAGITTYYTGVQNAMVEKPLTASVWP